MRFEDQDRLVSAMDAEHAGICARQLRLLSLIAEADRLEVWLGSGARDLAHWVAMRYGVSEWKARRWVESSRRLQDLPRISAAFGTGAIAIDKVVELTRFATPDTEGRLLPWAQRVSSGAIRRRADRETHRSLEDAEGIERSRRLAWWPVDEGRRLALEAELQGGRGRDRGTSHRTPRRRDACDAGRGGRTVRRAAPRRRVGPARFGIGAEWRRRECGSRDGRRPRLPGDPRERRGRMRGRGRRRHSRGDCATSDLLGQASGRHRGCVQNPVRIGRSSREPTPAMMRALRHRDGECRFPACGARRFTNAHHIRWWSGGGPTELDNLLLVCGFHHRLVHEYGWRVGRTPEGAVTWFRSDGTGYRAGPATPDPSPAFEVGTAALP
jgi:hypothetical protein